MIRNKAQLKLLVPRPSRLQKEKGQPSYKVVDSSDDEDDYDLDAIRRRSSGGHSTVEEGIQAEEMEGEQLEVQGQEDGVDIAEGEELQQVEEIVVTQEPEDEVSAAEEAASEEDNTLDETEEGNAEEGTREGEVNPVLSYRDVLVNGSG